MINSEVKERQVVYKNEKVVCRQVDGQAVLLNLENGEYFMLNNIGSLIWNLISTSDIKTIIDDLSNEYKASSEEVRQAVENFISELTEEGLLCQ